MSSLKGDKVPCARLCHIVKWDDFDGYGFNLHAQKGKNGQFIGKVDDGSPSQAAGLKQGDRIIEVNEINIANETHKQVVERIKAFPNETKLLVVDQEADDYFRANNIIIKGTMAHVKVIKTPEKNPNSNENDEDIHDGSHNSSSLEDNTHKSNNTSRSSSTAVGMTTTASMRSSDSEETVGNKENGNGTTPATGNGMSTDTNSNSTSGTLNLKMSAKELRAQLAARKKYDPKKESIGFKDKFDIVQKL